MPAFEIAKRLWIFINCATALIAARGLVTALSIESVRKSKKGKADLLPANESPPLQTARLLVKGVTIEMRKRASSMDKKDQQGEGVTTGKERSSNEKAKSGQAGSAKAREDRLAEALRANLRRRKSAAKSRKED